MFFSFLRSRGGSREHLMHEKMKYRQYRLRRTLESLDDKGRCGGDDVNLGLTVLDGELDGNAETLPRAGGLGDIFTDLLR